jgi:hypothetical protein
MRYMYAYSPLSHTAILLVLLTAMLTAIIAHVSRDTSVLHQHQGDVAKKTAEHIHAPTHICVTLPLYAHWGKQW